MLEIQGGIVLVTLKFHIALAKVGPSQTSFTLSAPELSAFTPWFYHYRQSLVTCLNTRQMLHQIESLSHSTHIYIYILQPHWSLGYSSGRTLEAYSMHPGARLGLPRHKNITARLRRWLLCKHENLKSSNSHRSQAQQHICNSRTQGWRKTYPCNSPDRPAILAKSVSSRFTGWHWLKK
jgi:hypothetical protein